MKNILVFCAVGCDEQSLRIVSHLAHQVTSYKFLKSYLAGVLQSECDARFGKIIHEKNRNSLPNLLELIKFGEIVQNEKLHKIHDFVFKISGDSLQVQV